MLTLMTQNLVNTDLSLQPFVLGAVCVCHVTLVPCTLDEDTLPFKMQREPGHGLRAVHHAHCYFLGLSRSLLAESSMSPESLRPCVCLLSSNMQQDTAPFRRFFAQRNDSVLKLGTTGDYLLSLNNQHWNSGPWHLNAPLLDKKSIRA